MHMSGWISFSPADIALERMYGMYVKGFRTVAVNEGVKILKKIHNVEIDDSQCLIC